MQQTSALLPLLLVRQRVDGVAQPLVVSWRVVQCVAEPHEVALLAEVGHRRRVAADPRLPRSSGGDPCEQVSAPAHRRAHTSDVVCVAE